MDFVLYNFPSSLEIRFSSNEAVWGTEVWSLHISKSLNGPTHDAHWAIKAIGKTLIWVSP